MSFKRLFSERGTYDVTMPISDLQHRCNDLTSVITSTADLQQRCNDLTSVITSTADMPTGNNTTNEVQPERTTPPTTTSSSPVSSTSSPSAMIPKPTNMHVDAIVKVAPTANIGFHTFEIDQKSQKADGDALSNKSKSNKCENCIESCLYYSNGCCDCTIL